MHFKVAVSRAVVACPYRGHTGLIGTYWSAHSFPYASIHVNVVRESDEEFSSSRSTSA